MRCQVSELQVLHGFTTLTLEVNLVSTNIRIRDGQENLAVVFRYILSYTVYFCGSCKYVDLQDLASKKCCTFEFTQMTRPYFGYVWIEIYKQATNQREDHSSIVDCWMICLKQVNRDCGLFVDCWIVGLLDGCLLWIQTIQQWFIVVCIHSPRFMGVPLANVRPLVLNLCWVMLSTFLADSRENLADEFQSEAPIKKSANGGMSWVLFWVCWENWCWRWIDSDSPFSCLNRKMSPVVQHQLG